ncbi:MAG: hypothetical protein RLZZ410_141 [Pseudomonadota bacterium]|jgi:hypothetical protein
MTLAFNTLKFKNKLNGVGIPVTHAEGMTEPVRDSFEHLATKKDLHLLELRLLHSQGVMKNDLIMWMVGLSLIQMGLCLSVVLSFHGN